MAIQVPFSKFPVACVAPILRRELEMVELWYIDSVVLLLLLNVQFSNQVFFWKCSS